MTTATTFDHVIGAKGLLSVRLADGSVRLHGVDGGSLRIRDRGNGDLTDTFEVELGDGNVSLDADKGRRTGGDDSPDIDVDIPRGATLVIETRSAEIEAEGLVGDQRYKTTSGDLTLRGVTGLIAVDTVSGEVEISAIGDTAMRIKTVSGDVDLRAATLTSLDATTTSGDVRIAAGLAGPGPFSIVTVSGDTLLAPVGDLRVEMATLSGDLTSKVGGRTEGRRGQWSLQVGAGGPLVSLRSLSGDLHVVPPTPVEAASAAADHTPSLRDTEPSVDPAAANPAIAAAYDAARLRILRSLERGEIDVAEAGLRLEALDGPDPLDEAAGPAADRPAVPPADVVEAGTETARFDPSDATDA